jgi:hypothetical protein
LFRFNIETAYFGVSIDPKQTKNEPKQAGERKFEKNLSSLPNLQVFQA